MRLNRPIILSIVMQIAGVAFWFVYFRYIWPGPHRSTTPAGAIILIGLVWLTPFILYAIGEKVWPVARGRVARLATAFIGSIAIGVAYAFSLSLLRHWQELRFQAYYEQCLRSHAEACMASIIIDPPQPPQYWEWAAAGSIAAVIGLFAILHIWKARAGSKT